MIMKLVCYLCLGKRTWIAGCCLFIFPELINQAGRENCRWLQNKFMVDIICIMVFIITPGKAPLRMVPHNTGVVQVDYGEKVDLSKGYWNSKRKLWVTVHFSENIK